MSAHGSAEVFDKYVAAGKLAFEAYQHALEAAEAGAALGGVCAAGDAYIAARSQGQINRGVCHPMTAQLDHIVCNHAPKETKKETNTLGVGDSKLLKLQVGAHVDGYGVVVGSNHHLKHNSDAQRLVDAANDVAKLVLSIIKPGTTNLDLVKAAAQYLPQTPYRGIPGLLAHSHAQYDIQGPKCIDLFPTPENATAAGITFESGEVYTIEVWLTDSADSEAVPDDSLDCTLHLLEPRKQVEATPDSVRASYDQVDHLVGSFPFHTRTLNGLDNAASRLKDAKLLNTYPPFVIKDKSRSVAQSVVSFVVTEVGVHVLSPQILA